MQQNMHTHMSFIHYIHINMYIIYKYITVCVCGHVCLKAYELETAYVGFIGMCLVRMCMPPKALLRLPKCQYRSRGQLTSQATSGVETAQPCQTSRHIKTFKTLMALRSPAVCFSWSYGNDG